MKIETTCVRQALKQNVDAHGGKLCGCDGCRAAAIGAFISDLAIHFGDDGPQPGLDAIRHSALVAWLSNGKTPQELIASIAMLSNPNADEEGMVVKVEFLPFTKDEHDLMNAEPAGSA